MILRFSKKFKTYIFQNQKWSQMYFETLKELGDLLIIDLKKHKKHMTDMILIYLHIWKILNIQSNALNLSAKHFKIKTFKRNTIQTKIKFSLFVLLVYNKEETFKMIGSSCCSSCIFICGLLCRKGYWYLQFKILNLW